MFGRSLFLCCAAVGAGIAASSVYATPVASVPLSDGKVLDVQSIVGSGSNSAYEVVDFSDGLSEAWQYNFNGAVDGYTMLSAISSATTLQVNATYYPQYSEHLVSYLTDGPNTTEQYPALYFSPPAPGDPSATSAQGITFDQAQVGVDQLTITNGEIVGWDNSYANVPLVPESSVPEPAGVALLGIAGALLGYRHRRQ